LIGRKIQVSEFDLSEFKPRDGDISRSPMGGRAINASYMHVLGFIRSERKHSVIYCSDSMYDESDIATSSRFT
jgi:hypothetical protein